MTRIFFFATLREANATIRLFDAIPQHDDDRSYLFSGGKIVICGMGMKEATSAALRTPTTNCSWVNLGVAGSLEGSILIGRAVTIGKVSLLEWDQRRSVFRPTVEEDLFIDRSIPSTLYTSPVPLYSTPDVPLQASFVDMEGHAIAKCAIARKVPLTMIKVVSDFCSSSSHSMILDNLDALSVRLAEEASHLLPSLRIG